MWQGSHRIREISGDRVPVYLAMRIEEPGHGLRADASRNRRLIVAAAREVLVEYGADAPLDEIARRAGVGNATLYRRFPDRRELIRAVGVEVMERLAQEAGEALAQEPDAFQALRRFVHAAADQMVGAVFPALAQYTFDDEPFLATRERAVRATQEIIDRGVKEGLVRPDIALTDLMVPLTQLTRPLPGAGSGPQCQTAHRYLELLLDGMRTPQRAPLPQPPLSLEDLQEACSARPPDHRPI